LESEVRGGCIIQLVLAHLRKHNEVALGSAERLGRIEKSATAKEKVHTGASPPRKARKQKDASTLSSSLSLHLFSSTLICGTE